MKILLTLTLFFSTQTLFGQELRVDRKILHQLFKVDQQQKSKEFIICNTNNGFSKNDTLYLISDINYFYQSNSCCEFIEWKFQNEKLMSENEFQICREPASAKVFNDKNIFKIKIEQEKENVYLLRYQNLKLLDKFLVASLSTTQLANTEKTYSTLKLIKVK
jgi:calcineurin-like phosphoesterase family protein